MSYELSKEEKISIINQHLKSLEYSKYNLRISLLELNSGNNSRAESIEDLQTQIDSIVSKQKALNAEIKLLDKEEKNG